MGMRVMRMAALFMLFSPRTSSASTRGMSTIQPVLNQRISTFKFVRIPAMRLIIPRFHSHC